MGQRFDAVLALLALDHLDVGQHVVLLEVARKEVDGEGVAVEAGEGDELPDEAGLAELNLQKKTQRSNTSLEEWSQLTTK